MIKLTKSEEAKIRREGIPLNALDTRRLLRFIDVFDPNHFAVEPEIVVKLEMLSNED